MEVSLAGANYHEICSRSLKVCVKIIDEKCLIFFIYFIIFAGILSHKLIELSNQNFLIKSWCNIPTSLLYL